MYTYLFFVLPLVLLHLLRRHPYCFLWEVVILFVSCLAPFALETSNTNAFEAILVMATTFAPSYAIFWCWPWPVVRKFYAAVNVASVMFLYGNRVYILCLFYFHSLLPFLVVLTIVHPIRLTRRQDDWGSAVLILGFASLLVEVLLLFIFKTWSAFYYAPVVAMLSCIIILACPTKHIKEMQPAMVEVQQAAAAASDDEERSTTQSSKEMSIEMKSMIDDEIVFEEELQQ